MILVTGGAGFIGSNLVRALNDRGIDDVMVVDSLDDTEKITNLSGLTITDFMDKEEFYNLITSRGSINGLTAVFHQGACSDTMATDGKYIMHNNFTYSKALFHYCQQHKIQFIYASSASVYGDGEVFAEDPVNEAALNVYAWSKLVFDNFIRSQKNAGTQCVGLRYFNVYGPGEIHKGRMASVAWHFYNQYSDNAKVRLFTGTGGYGDGEQLRDFVYVQDVVDVNLFYLDNPSVSGIFNVGTGHCQSFNDVALAVINYCRKSRDLSEVNLGEAVNNKEIIYFPPPDALHGKYQSYTCADLGLLRQSGYDQPFHEVSVGVSSYLYRLAS